MTGQFPIRGSWIPVFPKTGHRHCIHGDTLDGEEKDSQECRSTSDNTAHPAAKPSSKLFLRTSENPRGGPPLSAGNPTAIPRCAAASGSPSAGSALQEDGKMEGRGHAAPWKSRACCAVFSTSCPWKRKGEDRSAAAPGGARRAQQQHRPVQPCSAADPGAAPPQPPSHGHAVPAHPGRYCPPRSPRPSSSGSRRHAGLQPGPGRRAAGSTVERPAGQNAERGRGWGGSKRLRSPLEPGAAPRPARRHKGRHAALRPHLPARWAAVRARRRHGAVRYGPARRREGRGGASESGGAGRGGGAGP